LDYFIINILSDIWMTVLVGVAYLTILERNIFRYIQFRKGLVTGLGFWAYYNLLEMVLNC